MSTVQGEPITAAAEHEVAGRSLGWWGMIFFITSEALIFANLIAAYLYLEIRKGSWTLPSGSHLDVAYQAFNTIILLSSSIPAILGKRGIVKGNRRQLVLVLLRQIRVVSIFCGVETS